MKKQITATLLITIATAANLIMFNQLVYAIECEPPFTVCYAPDYSCRDNDGPIQDCTSCCLHDDD